MMDFLKLLEGYNVDLLNNDTMDLKLTNDSMMNNATLNLTDLDLSFFFGHDQTKDAFTLARFYLLAFIIIIGILFNLLAIAVFLQKGIKKTVTVIYFFALACADNLVLIGELIHWLGTQTSHGHILGYTLIDTNIGMCRFNYFIRYFGRFLSSWLVVTICVERFITVAYPLGLARSSTPRRAKFIICGLVIVSFAMASPAFFIFAIESDELGSSCRHLDAKKDFYNAWIMCIVVIGELFFPSVIVLVFTILIIRKLTQASLRRMHSKEGQKQSKKEESRNNQTTIALLAVSIAFVTLRTPYAIMYPIHLNDHNIFSYSYSALNNFRNAHKIMFVIAVMNYAVNFPLYIITGKKFRKEFVNFVLCRGVVMQRRSSRSGSISLSTKNSSIRRGSRGTTLTRQNDYANDKSSSTCHESHL